MQILPFVCQTIYRSDDRNPALLERALEAAEKVRELQGETATYFRAMSLITLVRADAGGALHLALQSIEADPNFSLAYDAVGQAHKMLGNKKENVSAREENVRLHENDKTAHFNLLIALHELGSTARLQSATEWAIPIFERHTRLNPDDYYTRASLANILLISGKESEALRVADSLSAIESLDVTALYNLACIYRQCKAPLRGMEHLRRAVQAGFRNIDEFRRDSDLDALRDPSSPYHAEFEVLMEQMSEP